MPGHPRRRGRGESRCSRRRGAGIAITPESAEELAAAVRKLADDPALCEAYGRAGRAYADQNLDRAKVAARFLALLDEVAARRPISEPAARARQSAP